MAETEAAGNVQADSASSVLSRGNVCSKRRSKISNSGSRAYQYTRPWADFAPRTLNFVFTDWLRFVFTT